VRTPRHTEHVIREERHSRGQRRRFTSSPARAHQVAIVVLVRSQANSRRRKCKRRWASQSAIAGQRITCWRRRNADLPTSSTALVRSAITKICAIENLSGTDCPEQHAATVHPAPRDWPNRGVARSAAETGYGACHRNHERSGRPAGGGIQGNGVLLRSIARHRQAVLTPEGHYESSRWGMELERAKRWSIKRRLAGGMARFSVFVATIPGEGTC